MPRRFTVSAILLLASLLVADRAWADDEGCHPDLSSPSECWHSCETEDEITICEIIACPEGINCSGVWNDEAEQFVLTIPYPEPAGPRVGDTLTHYVDGKAVRGRVTTRLYSAIAVDGGQTKLGQTELVIVVTPYLVQPTDSQ